MTRSSSAAAYVVAAILASSIGCGGDGTTKESDSGTIPSPTGDTSTTPDTDTDPTLTVYSACVPDYVPVVQTGTSTKATSGVRCYVGNATVTEEAYEGIDQVWIFPKIGQYELAAPVCVLRYTLTQTATRDDCSAVGMDCAWAFDLTLSDAAVEDPMGLCLSTVGYDAASVGSLNGTAMSRAFHPDFYGHAMVRMEEIDGKWKAVGLATYDFMTDAFSYADQDGDEVPL